MSRILRAVLAVLLLPLAVAAAMVMAGPAQAAALTQVTNFGTNPTNLNMYLYVPDNVAARPALLVLVHYCTGTASGIFNGNGHDYVTAADRYKYIIVLPEATRSGGCFDVSTPAALRRDGGSDSTGIMSMVAYTRARYNVDPGRIVVSGFSSGAMMTNVLAAEYPDVFAAGSAFSGVPAGCFATTDGSMWNSQCSGGNVSRTAQQWGDVAHAMYPGYTGGYPRMQLWHGTTDTTLAYPNFGEEIKQWTYLNGVSQTPAFTDHPQSTWTRTRYGNTGTQATVEGVSISGVGHQLPMTGQLAYAISFLGLDGSTPPTTAAPTTAPPTTAPPTTAPPTTAPPTTAPPTTVPPTTAAPTTAPPAGGCRVADVVNAWNNGLTENITVTNTGSSTVNGWSVVFTLPAGQTITGSWNASYAPTSGQVTASNVSYNATIPPGGSVSFGFQATHTGNAAAPTAFTLNGSACTIG
ncbi:PHB depolymerase family esterase [Plantactinospora sp. KBS50]|uniref:extracellular catalytic domain type 1 short-chain-length polyhydroxyalkanoate depolymerase n=1 Tax=Plantactinospora sp. KBS50 TaxID=2024580 RepID=UPI000BAB0A81|nr:PHB depolymerase family esterase [Plantactinospora sp. KBS50]ASW54909.1 esterase [Plantactinospora sp. KBS50]